jgi:hypothetical protein
LSIDAVLDEVMSSSINCVVYVAVYSWEIEVLLWKIEGERMSEVKDRDGGSQGEGGVVGGSREKNSFLPETGSFWLVR